MLIVFQGGGDVAVPAVSSPTSDRATKTGQDSLTILEQVTYTTETSHLHYKNVSITLQECVNYTTGTSQLH